MADKEKRIGEALDFDFDFAPITNETANEGGDYLNTGETLISKTITVSGAESSSDLFINTNTTVKVWLSANGTNEVIGDEAVITCECVTSNSPPRTVIRSMAIKILPNDFY